MHKSSPRQMVTCLREVYTYTASNAPDNLYACFKILRDLLFNSVRQIAFRNDFDDECRDNVFAYTACFNLFIREIRYVRSAHLDCRQHHIGFGYKCPSLVIPFFVKKLTKNSINEVLLFLHT